MNLEYLKQNALMQVGKPYIWAGQSPILGFDCSGLIVFLLRSAGVISDNKDYTAQGLYDMMKKTASLSVRKLGAVAFYGKDEFQITHCAFILDEEWIIEAHGDSNCLDKDDAISWNHDNGAYVRITSFDNRSDLVNIFIPKY